ncbi:MAG: amidohydrolase family protein, partial [Pseudomonadota bacterium]
RPLWERYARDLGPRFIPFTGQSELNRIYRHGGIAAMEDATSPEIQEFLKEAEEDLKLGRAKGIGTIFANNSRGHPDPGFRRKARTDAPSIRLLYGLAAKYDAVVMMQMVPDPDSVEGFERLLASDRRAKILWTQCGTDTAPGEVRPLMQRHPNLYCELSWRYPPVVPPHLAFRNIFDETGPKPEWLELIEEFPDRFLVGNDAHIRSQYDRATEVVRTGLLPYLKPATARMVAYENAERLFKLK